MNPSASQAYLAIDILGALQGDETPVAKRASEVILAAFDHPDWTGKTPRCSEYGKPPISDDPEAQAAVRTLSPLIARLAIGGEPLATVEDMRKIIQETSGGPR